MLLESCSGENKLWEGGREEENLILIAVRAGSVPSAGNKHHNHTGGTARSSNSEATELQQAARFTALLQSSLPLLFLIHSFTVLVDHIFLPSLLFPLSHPSFLNFHPLIRPYLPFSRSFSSSHSPYILRLFTLILSSIMDSLEISASCSGPCAPGASQAVLIPAQEESSRQR